MKKYGDLSTCAYEGVSIQNCADLSENNCHTIPIKMKNGVYYRHDEILRDEVLKVVAS